MYFKREYLLESEKNKLAFFKIMQFYKKCIGNLPQTKINMILRQQINERLKSAMKENNAEMKDVIRGIISKITEAEKANSNTELTDDEIIKVIDKLAKQREESIVQFKQGNREDLVQKEEFQLSVLKEYLPQKMDEAATRKIVQDAIAAGATNMGLLMKELNKHGNLIDKKVASQIAKELLG